MPSGRTAAAKRLRQLRQESQLPSLAEQLRPRTAHLPPRVRGTALATASAIEGRWRLLKAPKAAREALLPQDAGARARSYVRNIENFIGEVRIPVGIAGPLRINGLAARRDYYVPLATHEATLVASYNRGMQLISQAGGCAAWVLSEGVSRSPGFVFDTTVSAGLFAAWAIERHEDFRRAAGRTTRHGRLVDMRLAVEGNHVYLIFDYTTGDAAGQNMVTLATDAICRYIERRSPVKPVRWFVEANMSGDKKASALAFLSVRGRKTTAETTIPAGLIAGMLSTTPECMADYWRLSALGGVMSGTLGVHGHLANGLAALYLACGQDIACVSESSVGVTRLETTPSGDLYAAVTLPSLTVGTVGGGTSLPTARACLDLLGLSGDGSASAFAELCAGVVLAGELSIIGAICAGHFSSAHARRARGQRGARKPHR